ARIPQPVPSFPTRRSSDLLGGSGVAQVQGSESQKAQGLAIPATTRFPLWDASQVSASSKSSKRFSQIMQHQPLSPGITHLQLPRSEEHTSELQSLAYLVCR